MINAKQLRELIVRPALKGIGLWTQEAEDLVMGTAAQESRLHYLDQIDKAGKPGPAYGLWQMERITHDDIWRAYLNKNVRTDMRARLLSVACMADKSLIPPVEALAYNLRYGALMCRVHYLRKPGAIPSTLQGQAAYWKKHYNTRLGKGKPEEYVKNYALVS